VYFYSGWNCFDFMILIVTLMPQPNQMLASLRALRLVKLIKGVSPRNNPQLYSVMAAFSTAVMSFRYVGALWLLTIYLYAIVGVQMYRDNDPKMFGTLHSAMFALFGISSFDALGDTMYTQVQYSTHCTHYAHTLNSLMPYDVHADLWL
jgi:voltage-gated sodium channel